jgi:hypothetical protein
MKITVTEPLSYIADTDGKRIKGLRGCRTELEVAQKLASLPKGYYQIIRPPVKVVIS